jgi:hypothetical protein
MRSIDDIMRERVDSLDMSRGEQLANIQELLSNLYPGKVRARRLQRQVLTIETPSSAVANDLRLRREELLDKFADMEVVDIKISIG